MFNYSILAAILSTRIPPRGVSEPSKNDKSSWHSRSYVQFVSSDFVSSVSGVYFRWKRIANCVNTQHRDLTLVAAKLKITRFGFYSSKKKKKNKK